MLKLNCCQEKGHQARPLILVRLNTGTAPLSLSYLACSNNWHEVSDKLKHFGSSFFPARVTWGFWGIFYLTAAKVCEVAYRGRGCWKQPGILNSDLYQTCQTPWAWKSYLKTDHHMSKDTFLRTYIYMGLLVWQRFYKFNSQQITQRNISMCS